MTDYQNKLITHHFSEIKTKISKILSNKKYRNKLSVNNRRTLLEETISHIPEVTLEWKEDRAKKLGFSDFVAYRSILRLVDEYRFFYRMKGISYNNVKILEEIEANLYSEKGYILPEDIQLKIENMGKNPKSFSKIQNKDLYRISDPNIYLQVNNISVEDENFYKIEFNDEKSTLIDSGISFGGSPYGEKE